MNFYDVIIIGAGPAGCATALTLSGSGLRVLLVDKGVFPRDKTCGDAIPGHSFSAMDAIKPEWGRAMREFANKTDIHSLNVFAPNGKTVTIPWVLYSYNSKRQSFDNFLIDLVRKETETEILENSRFHRVEVKPDGVDCFIEGGKKLRTQVVIGCDGAYSVVKRNLAKTGQKSNNAISVRAYFKGVSGVEIGVNEAYFFDNIRGYFWIFPLENGLANVGFGISEDKSKKESTPTNLRNTFKSIIATYPTVSSRFENAIMVGGIKGFLLPMAMQDNQISGERFMLCGDAANLINPLSGHGIDKAMWSGLMAAKQAITCFQRSDFSSDFMKQYGVAVDTKFEQEFKNSRLIVSAFQNFSWVFKIISTIGVNQKFVRWFVRNVKI